MKALLILMCSLYFQALAAELPDASVGGIRPVKEWARSRFQAAASLRQNYYPSPGFWGEEIVYQIQVDRFNNGNLENDHLNVEEYQQTHQATADWFGLPDYRHGGDLQGIMDRMDYLKDLGVTVLWLTPIQKHNGSYHGYCTVDFTEVDPGFGTKEELKKLVSMAHAKGIKVVLDIVVNHMCNPKTTYRRPPNHYGCADALNNKNWKGEAGGSEYQGELDFAADFFPPFKSQFFFNRCGANSQSDMQGVGPTAVYGDFGATMFDFDTRNYDFQEIFTDLHKYWVAFADIDGFRLDAAKHVTEDFIAYFSTHIRDYARTLGKKNFFVVGEVAGPSDWIGRRVGKMYSNPQNPNDHGNVPASLTKRMWELKSMYLSNPAAAYPGMNAAYDFAHGGTAIDVLLNRRPSRALEDHFFGGYLSDIANQGDYRLSWNLLEIHDWPRFVSHDPTSPERSALGLSYLALAEGSPIIYYGMEQGFNGDCHFGNMNAGRANGEIQKDCKGSSHALYRQDMFVGGMYRLGSTVGAINKHAYIGKVQPTKSPEWTQDPMLNREHTVYKISRKLNHIRQSCKALKYGQTKFRWVSNGTNGMFAFSRVDGGYEALVIMNTDWQKRGIPELMVNDARPGQRWVNLLNVGEQAWGNGNGKLNFAGLEINGNSVMVLVPDYALGAYDKTLEAHLCK